MLNNAQAMHRSGSANNSNNHLSTQVVEEALPLWFGRRLGVPPLFTSMRTPLSYPVLLFFFLQSVPYLLSR